MIRFFAAPEDISTDSIRLSEDDSKHIRALRLRPYEQFIVCDGNGTDYVCQLGEREDYTVAEVLEQHKSQGEPTITCKAYMAYSKGDRLEYAVQKSVELGVNEIVLFESERCVSIPRDIPKRVGRLQKIAHETAKQSGRGIIPAVSCGGEFEKIVNEALRSSDFTLLFYENEDYLHIKRVLEKYFSPLRGREEYESKTVSIITGPEGGFEPHEIKLAVSKDIPIVSLGPRILRSETAPVVALATIMYQTGNL